jgi:hypothetical protein
MKAIVISDDNDVIEKVGTILTAHRYDPIVYRWLLKALDNVEEIRPDVVIISACDYPRHWKTFSQFVKSGISGEEPQIILYTPQSFPQTELEKAKTLGIKGTFSSVDEGGLEHFTSILNSASKQFLASGQKENKSQPAFGLSQIKSYGLIFTHPETEAFITGTVLACTDDTIEFSPDIPLLSEGLSGGDHIGEVSFKNNNTYSYCSADIIRTGKTLFLKLGTKYEN